jgi:F0F1-type ATP synthase membrane subunit b/b'
VAITPEGLRRLAHLAARAQDEQIRAEATQLLQQVKEAAEGEARRRLEEEIEAGRGRGEAHRL